MWLSAAELGSFTLFLINLIQFPLTAIPVVPVAHLQCDQGVVVLTTSCRIVLPLLQPLPQLKPIVCFSSAFMSYKLLYSDFIL